MFPGLPELPGVSRSRKQEETGTGGPLQLPFQCERTLNLLRSREGAGSCCLRPDNAGQGRSRAPFVCWLLLKLRWMRRGLRLEWSLRKCEERRGCDCALLKGKGLRGCCSLELEPCFTEGTMLLRSTRPWKGVAGTLNNGFLQLLCASWHQPDSFYLLAAVGRVFLFPIELPGQFANGRVAGKWHRSSLNPSQALLTCQPLLGLPKPGL